MLIIYRWAGCTQVLYDLLSQQTATATAHSGGHSARAGQSHMEQWGERRESLKLVETIK